MTSLPEGSTIPLGDVAAVEALPANSVLLCRVEEVFQLKDTPVGPLWFAIGYGESIWSPANVASWGPLRVLYNPDQPHAATVT